MSQGHSWLGFILLGGADLLFDAFGIRVDLRSRKSTEQLQGYPQRQQALAHCFVLLEKSSLLELYNPFLTQLKDRVCLTTRNWSDIFSYPLPNRLTVCSLLQRKGTFPVQNLLKTRKLLKLFWTPSPPECNLPLGQTTLHLGWNPCYVM